MTEVSSPEVSSSSTDGVESAEQQSSEGSTQQTSAEKEAAKQLRKLKVRGKEIEVDDDKYHEYASKGAAAHETWQEASAMRKQAEELIHRLKNDPMSILKDPSIGLDFRKLAEDYIWEQIQEERLSPEQKEKRKIEKELENYRKQEAERKKSEDDKKQEELNAAYQQEVDQKISKALSSSGLPKTTGTVRRMVEYMLHDVRRGISRDPSDYTEFVRQDYMNDIKDLFSETDGDTLLKFVGDPVLKKIKESDLKRIKTPTPSEGHTFVPGKGMVKNQDLGSTRDRKLRGSDWDKEVMRGFMSR